MADLDAEANNTEAGAVVFCITQNIHQAVASVLTEVAIGGPLLEVSDDFLASSTVSDANVNDCVLSVVRAVA